MSRRSTHSPLWRLPSKVEVDEEIEHHLELLTRDLIAEGVDAQAARRIAEQRFGDADGYAKDCRRLARRRNRRWHWRQVIDEAAEDLRSAIRQLRRRPVLSATLIGLLAVGLGMATAGTDLIDRALLAPPDFAQPERIVALWEANPNRGVDENVVSPANFLAWRDETTCFDALAGFVNIALNLDDARDAAPPLRVQVRAVTEGYFDALAVTPLIGRSFTPEDATADSGDVVLLSHRLWQSRYGGSHDVIGEQLELDGETQQIIGVLPPATSLHMGPKISPYGDPADLFAPLTISDAWRQPRGRWMQVIGRLSDGISLETAQSQLDVVMGRQVERHPRFFANWQVHAEPLLDHLREPLTLPIAAFFAAGLVVLLIAAFNASSLLLGRTMGRSSELAVRTALGAGRGRLLRQLLVEGLVLAACAGAIAWLLANGGAQLVMAALPTDLPSSGGGRSGWILLALTVACAGLLGLLPGLAVGRRRGSALASRTIGDSAGRQRLRSGLVFAQVALTLVLLISAGLMLRSVARLLGIDPGFAADRLVSFSLSPARDAPVASIDAMYDDLLANLAAFSGVASAGAVSHLPLASAGAATSFYAADRPRPAAGEEPVADIRIVRGDFFATLQIPLIAGRTFDGSERPHHEPGSILVSQALAERLWPDGSALERQVFVHWGEASSRRVIGVVGNVRFAGLSTPARDAIYFPASQEPQRAMTIVLATDGDRDHALATVLAEARSAAARLAPDLPLHNVNTMRGLVESSIGHQRLLTRALLAFGIVALLLAAVGIYGLTALTVKQRTREIGVRIALGATPSSLVRGFLRSTALLIASALLVGMVIAVALGRVLASGGEALLFGIDPWDPPTLAVTFGLISVCSMAAAILPVRRAARLDPSHALRAE